MAITGTALINKVALLLFDVNNVKWSRLELLGWINDAQRAAVTLAPEVTALTLPVLMVHGSRQAIPADGFVLLDVICNMGTTGGAYGPAIKRVDSRILDETNPAWQSAAQGPTPTLCMYNMRDRKAFNVYPPADATSFIQITYAQMPADMAVEANNISIADIYEPAVIDFVMFRCKSKQADFSYDPDKAAAYYASFRSYITGSASVDGRLATGMGEMADAATQGQGSAG